MRPETLSTLLSMQQGEVTESAIYERIASQISDEKNRSIILQIAKDEKRHADLIQTYTGQVLQPDKGKIRHYSLISRLLGFTFALKLMEKGEDINQAMYTAIRDEFPEADELAHDESTHEQSLLDLLSEDRLKYVGSMVLGLNDALVELTGTLAGLTLAITNLRLIALSGLITGLSATFSMAASEYLSARADNDPDAKKSAVYTGIAYLLTVILMVTPYLLLMDIPGDLTKWLALGSTLTVVVLIIFFFNYYISVAKTLNFKRRFWEMVLISFGVAGFSFIVGLLMKTFLGIDA